MRINRAPSWFLLHRSLNNILVLTEKCMCGRFLGCVVCIYGFTLDYFLSKVTSCMPFLICKHKAVYAVAALCRKSTSFSSVFQIVFLLS